jgi:iron complex outermembrane receptor protein/outer membrane receptor for ferrienterochelin and colicins
MIKLFILYILLCVSSFTCFAQESSVRFKVIDKETKVVLENVSVETNGDVIGKTNEEGVIIRLIEVEHDFIFSLVGYETQTINAKDKKGWITVEMQKSDAKLDEVTVISSTRNNQRIENSPLKVEVLGREEMDEESTIKPANLAGIIGDVSGVQIQQTSATNGNSNVRIQGLSGQYTQILKDGMPLFEGFSGGLGALSIPPLDLKQVELIKGSASTLYGGGAIGGLINIISRKPNTKQDAVVIINASTLNEKNVNVYLAKKYKKVGYTFFGGSTKQAAVDVNKDGFSDVAKNASINIHPRLFLYLTKYTTIAVGNNISIEKGIGGDINYIKNNILLGGIQFFQRNNLMRSSTDAVFTTTLAHHNKLEIKTSYSSFNREIVTNLHQFKGQQNNFFSEASILIPYKKNNIVVGLNFISELFVKKTSQYIPINNFSNSTFGVFVQNTIKLNEKTIVEAGIRNDITKNYGNAFLPRLAFIHHLDKHWGTRAGIGFGYKIPNAFNSQITDIPVQSILPIAKNVTAEKSIGYNAEINYKYEWNKNELFINHAFFLTNITSPIITNENVYGETYFLNAAKSITTKGFDTYIQLKLDELELYAGVTYTIANRNYLTTNSFVPYTPQTRAALTAMQEIDGGWRVGIEASYNGFQRRDDGTKTPAYVFMAGLVEKKFAKHFTAVLNCENFLDYRQSKVEALYIGSISAPDFKTLWAPIDGRVVNLAVKWSY